MSIVSRSNTRLMFISLFTLILIAGAVRAQTTTFTYQGRLTDNGSPASGNYDVQFALFGVLSGGSQIGSTLTRSNVAVSSGAFAVQLDFGVSAFPGADRFLEISVRPHSNDPNIPAYSLLAPRQPVTSTPYAIRTVSAVTADTATNATQLGGVAASQFVQTNDSRLSDARPPVAGSSSYIQNGTGQQVGANLNLDGKGVIGGDLIANGQVGIGVPTPTEKLQVAGIIQSTTGGFKFPDGTIQATSVAASSVNRVIRGTMNFGGGTFEVSQNFSPAIDPTKSVVILGGAVGNNSAGECVPNSRETILVSLTSGTITVAIDQTRVTNPGSTIACTLTAFRVGYQIIEYK